MTGANWPAIAAIGLAAYILGLLALVAIRATPRAVLIFAAALPACAAFVQAIVVIGWG